MKKAFLSLVFCLALAGFFGFSSVEVNAQSIAVISQEFAEAYTNPWFGAPIAVFFEEGEVIDVVSYDNGWVSFIHEGSTAHIPMSNVAILQAQSLVIGNNVFLLTAPTPLAPVATSVPMGYVLNTVGYFGEYFAVDLGGGRGTAYIHRNDVIGNLLSHLSEYGLAAQVLNTAHNREFFIDVNFPFGGFAYAGSGDAALMRRQVVEYALQFLGTPYRWGGTNLTRGVDCSGFVYAVFRSSLGITLNRVSRDQIRNGTIVGRNELLPGDLVFFATGRGGGISHVGIYIGNDEFVHSSSTRSRGVIISNLNEAYYVRTYVNAARIIH